MPSMSPPGSIMDPWDWICPTGVHNGPRGTIFPPCKMFSPLQEWIGFSWLFGFLVCKFCIFKFYFPTSYPHYHLMKQIVSPKGLKLALGCFRGFFLIEFHIFRTSMFPKFNALALRIFQFFKKLRMLVTGQCFGNKKWLPTPRPISNGKGQGWMGVRENLHIV